MAPGHAQLTLDIELDSEPINGTMSRANGAAERFNGWIQLVSLLQDAATTRPGGGAPVDPSSNGRLPGDGSG